MWLGMLADGEKLLLAGLRDCIPAGSDIAHEYRRLYEMQRDDRLAKRIRRDQELARRRATDLPAEDENSVKG